ncbi:MAG: hypothetical protein COV07_03280 [Candidatus Vogelbacteria bacterium CG10_big_fil_rev_8_21_14_0_10_45_14]|uniref:Homing endonuclease LAGLIDADG domain-containing protein n=1 Tax=Candidatus Vogelbacteria bacterium CG10_big_fil_rev_8_21_14_0_10_45_14 TaxID=1975042 RepID=A0A2H0RJJ6_9BACT|nr:MAG: hypothetical protein COV07_03280 [Candidatus Vogelbacteria bacterium CG10_big_fil_rev_8_21_14_0_10_45_14]
MSKNASNDSVNIQKPDNPQETFNVKNFYYTGLFAAEMSCSVIKATNNNPKGSHYYAVDFTVSNADVGLLKQVNRVVMRNEGIISPIKGAYNLSARGKRKVGSVLAFMDLYPFIIGDLAIGRVALLKEAYEYLGVYTGHSVHEEKTRVMSKIRNQLKLLKTTGLASKTYRQKRISNDATGYFLAGVLDGDGSFGFKKSGNRKQPFLLVAMKDRKIPYLFKDFLKEGNVRYRVDGVYHYECNKTQALRLICSIFLEKYPLRHRVQRNRLQKLQRILNDYTQSPSNS